MITSNPAEEAVDMVRAACERAKQAYEREARRAGDNLDSEEAELAWAKADVCEAIAHELRLMLEAAERAG